MARKKSKFPYRKFGDKTYEFVGSRGSKKDASDWAKGSRKRGRLVRVVHANKGRAGWHIYERSKKSKSKSRTGLVNR